jgi:hypothetical protein
LLYRCHPRAHKEHRGKACQARRNFGREVNLSLNDIKSFYNQSLVWLCWQSAANSFLRSNSLIMGKIQGNFADLAAKAGRGFGFPTTSQLVTPKFPTHLNREFSGANRELFPRIAGKVERLNLQGMEFSERTGAS